MNRKCGVEVADRGFVLMIGRQFQSRFALNLAVDGELFIVGRCFSTAC